MIRRYLLLTKPGIVVGNAVTASAGFALAARGVVDYRLLLLMLLGVSLIVASACVLNNYIDREADKKMARTKNRALAQNALSAQGALVFAMVLGIFGGFVLAFWTNPMALFSALAGFAIYVFWYSFWKYRSVHATAVGSIAGAMPPLAGYLAVSGRLDLGAFLIFLTLALWQMPHFYAIAIYRSHEYEKAGVPVLPLKKGMQAAKVQIALYIAAFTAAAALLTALDYTGYAYLTVMLVVSIAWLKLALKGFKAANDKVWARKIFGLSLVVIALFSTMVWVDVIRR